jgi:EAL domain-containing protein (putative c-di-GMP-specific phosphodiesterase class I)
VLGIDENTRSEQIIGLILTLAKFLQCEAVAEGVETKRQLDFLQKNGCSHFQGYLFHRPLPATGIDTLLAERSSI